VLHCQVGLDGPMHAGHAKELPVGCRISAEAHQGIGDRKAEAAREPGQLLGSVAQDDATAGIDHRPLGLEQQVHGLLDLPQMPLDDRVVRTQLDRLRILELALGGGHVLRNVDHHRTRATAVGDIEGLLDRHRQLVHVIDQEIVLDAGPGDADGIAFLEGILADILVRHLPEITTSGIESM
jgi:hypothetical protein